jgi:nucleoside-diphosphate-sugar epimerase
MTQTVAITGATGFIGRTITRRLVQSGHRVRALVRSLPSAGSRADRDVDVVSGRLEDSRSLATLIQGADVVVHCAGAVRGATQAQFDRVNVEGVTRLLQVMESQDRPPRLISLSSLAAREPRLSFYAASKFKGEQVLVKEARRVAWDVLRPPAVYGPGDRELLPVFRAMARGIAPVPGLPSARFSLLFVDDLASAVIGWLQRAHASRAFYTLDDGREGGYDWPGVATVVGRVCRRRVRVLPVPAWVLDVPAWLNRRASRVFGYAPMLTPEKLRELRHADWVCDHTALQAAIGWNPQVQLEEGLRRTPGWPCYGGDAAANNGHGIHGTHGKIQNRT